MKLPLGAHSRESGFARDVLHLYTLSAFGISQPLFDRLSGHVTYLTDHDLTRSSLVLLSAVVVLAIPTVLAIVEALVRAVCPQWRRRMHGALTGLLMVAIVCPAARHLVEHDWLVRWGIACYLVLGIALSAGALMVIVYVRTAWFPRWISWSSPAIALFPAAFLLWSPASTALFPRAGDHRPVHAGRPVPVVLVVFDSFCGMSLLNEEHQIDAVRFPHFARLAETATWYRNATTVRPRTGTAVPAILTGSMPRSAYPPATESEYPHNLFRFLQDTGQYEFVIFESMGRMASPELNREPPGDPGQPLSRVALVLPTLCAVYLHAVAPADLPLRLPGVPPEWYGLGRGQDARAIQGKGVFLNSWLDERDRQCERFVASLDHTSKPMLSFIHVCLPHYPWCFLPSGRRHQADLPYHQFPVGGFGANGEDWTDDELVVTHSWREYLLQVGYADRFVGQLQDRLRELKVFDDCLLIVVADHGVAFLPGHSRREPDGANLSEIMSIPLLIKYPRQHTGATDDRNVESIDILPTIADVLELELPYSVDGSSILDDSAPPRARKTLVRDDGELIVVDPRFPSKYDSVARMIATFGSGVRGDRFWHAGSAPELIGRRIESFPIDPGPGPSIELDPTTGFEPEARRAEEIIPCSLSGRVTRFGHHSEPLILAVAVNGVIVGVTRTSTDPRISDRFAVIVPESAFSSPADERRLFAISTDGDQTVLQPCQVTEDSDGM